MIILHTHAHSRKNSHKTNALTQMYIVTLINHKHARIFIIHYYCRALHTHRRCSYPPHSHHPFFVQCKQSHVFLSSRLLFLSCLCAQCRVKGQHGSVGITLQRGRWPHRHLHRAAYLCGEVHARHATRYHEHRAEATHTTTRHGAGNASLNCVWMYVSVYHMCVCACFVCVCLLIAL